MKGGRWKKRFEQAVQRLRAFAYRKPRPPQPAPSRPRLGLAFGGGFARGLAHIGVLKVLEENRVPVDCLAGTSVGSIIAGGYASGATIREMAEVAGKVRFKDFGSWTISRLGLATNLRMEALLRKVFHTLRFEDLKIPLAIVATDLMQGRPVLFTSGELSLAVRASCAYPGLFLPVASDGSWLVDGGLVWAVPTQAVRSLGAEVVVAVSLDNLAPALEPKSIVDVLGRSFAISQRMAEPLWREYADLVVEPEVSQYRWDEFDRADEIIAAGEQAMRAAWPALQRLLEPAPRRPAVGPPVVA